MGKAADALSDATLATTLDPSYAKGFYRKGMAELKLNRPSDAQDSFLQGVALVPDDKSFRDQLDKLSSTGVSSKSAAAVAAPRTSRPAAASTAPKPKTSEDDHVMRDDDTDSTVFRGYKKTSDGKTTTFFNNELDESTKALIGNIAPKKIDAINAPAVAPAPAAAGSVWNTAGKTPLHRYI